MNIKAEIRDMLLERIRKEILDLEYKRRSNKRTITDLAKEQKIIKAKLQELYRLRKELGGKYNG